MKKYIKGNFTKTIFSSDNGYIIGLIKVRETNDPSLEDYVNKSITFTGYFATLTEDDRYIFYGEGIQHPKYGFQYQVEEYERIKPEDKDGIVEFLSSDLFPGIGEKIAIKIVDTLGEQALDKILEDKSVLNQVPKLSSQKIDTIYQILTKYEESHKIVVYLTELGFNMKDALDIYNKYKSSTVMILENNIFDIIDEIETISFIKIDEISKKLNFEADDFRRIKACIIYVMKNIIFQTGNTYLEYPVIKYEVEKYLKFIPDENDFGNLIDELRFEGKIVVENDHYYLKDIYQAEQVVVEKIKILNEKQLLNYKKIEKQLQMLEDYNHIQYNEKQKEAIQKALSNRLLIITGGPGTGKTTIIKAIVEMYRVLNNYGYDELIEHLALLAPTGRASKRMSDSTNLPATTIHRFLKWNKENNEFLINEYNKDFSDFIIIDEVSMIDINLLSSLMKGLTNNIQIIFVGDANQLPSVGPGQILKDFIDSEVIDTVELDLLYRQSNDSYINRFAIEIKENSLSPDYKTMKDDYAFLECNSSMIKSTLKNLCEQIIQKGYDYKSVQILAPMYMGENGINNLNKELQNIFNPKSDDKEELILGDITFRKNDKILQLVNMPDENVFNGDIGKIIEIIPASHSESKKSEIYVDYDGIIVKYLPKDFNKIKHGYVITIHKSQGSEFELVILPISHSYNRMLYRKLIYTAVTRAKRKLILIGEEQAFLYGISNNNEFIRNTDLKNKLKKMYNNI